jgi:hypothetical protein
MLFIAMPGVWQAWQVIMGGAVMRAVYHASCQPTSQNDAHGRATHPAAPNGFFPQALQTKKIINFGRRERSSLGWD